MYIPEQFAESRTEVLQQLIQQHSFGTLVTAGEGGINAEHLPFVLIPNSIPDQASLGTLQCHVAKANPVWQHLSHDEEVLAVFQGPAAYISPSWYPGKRETGKAVPTWNYSVVHAYGYPRVIHEPEWLLRHVERLTNHQEAGREEPWQVADAPAEYIERLLRGIVGIEFDILRLLGKSKLSQNRSNADKLSVADGLMREGTSAAEAMAKVII